MIEAIFVHVATLARKPPVLAWLPLGSPLCLSPWLLLLHHINYTLDLCIFPSPLSRSSGATLPQCSWVYFGRLIIHYGYNTSGSFWEKCESIFLVLPALSNASFLLLKKKEREVANKMGSVEAFCNKLVWFLFRGFCEICCSIRKFVWGWNLNVDCGSVLAP